MAQKVYLIQALDCANCAAKAEAKIRQVPGVEAAVITFATMQLHLTAQDPDALLPQVLAAARTVEPDINFLPREAGEHHHHPHECHCHEEHHHHDHHPAPGNREWVEILAGAGLFGLGIALRLLLPRLPLFILAFGAAYAVLGWRVLATAGKNLIRGKVFDENFLMGISTLGAFAIREFAEGVGVMLFYRVGEFFEHRAMERSRSQIMAAVDLRPETVTLRSGEVIPAAEAKEGDILIVRPGDRIPLDGVVLTGESRVDTAPITGEPVPVGVGPGSQVVSGCVNVQGLLTLRAEKPLAESMVTRILSSVESAAASKPKIDRFITRFAKVYTPAVVAAAVLTAVIPGAITGNWNYWVYTALSFLVMSCPCALVLSVPLAFFSGIGTASKAGILFKGGAAMEVLAQVKAVVLDKTGTVTKGDFSLQEVVGPERTLALCAACEQTSSHPIAQSILAAARERGLILEEPEAVEELSGLGIRGILKGREVLCGNEKLLQKFGVEVEITTENTYGSRVFVAEDGEYLGCLVIADTLKPGAGEAISQLKGQGLHVAMLTGDQPESAQAVARAVGIEEVHAGLLPAEKLTWLQAIRAAKGSAMFVGDGINDAPVLAGADVGAAMGSGADAAIEAADVVFMKTGVEAIPEAVSIARRTKAIAMENVVFALGVKAVVMVLGLLGGASMWAAVFADSGVAMLCVLNAVRMLYRKKDMETENR